MAWYDPRTWFNQTPAPVAETVAPETYETTAPSLPGGRKGRRKTKRSRRGSKKNRAGKKSNRI
jgi:hypothetical protein